MATRAVTLTCATCATPFEWHPDHYRKLGLTTKPKRCPQCRSSRRRVLRATCLAVFPVVRLDFAPTWRRNGGGDLKHVEKGGAHGRLDMRTLLRPPPGRGDVVSVRAMRSVVRTTTGETEVHQYLVLEPVEEGGGAMVFGATEGLAPASATWSRRLISADGTTRSYYIGLEEAHAEEEGQRSG